MWPRLAGGGRWTRPHKVPIVLKAETSAGGAFFAEISSREPLLDQFCSFHSIFRLFYRIMQDFLLTGRGKMVRLTMGIRTLGINEKLANKESFIEACGLQCSGFQSLVLLLTCYKRVIDHRTRGTLVLVAYGDGRGALVVFVLPCRLPALGPASRAPDALTAPRPLQGDRCTSLFSSHFRQKGSGA